MPRLIDAGFLKAELIKWRDNDPYRQNRSLVGRWVRKEWINVFIRVVDVFPSMPYEPVKRGQWVKNDYGQTVCSHCRHPIPGYWGMYEGCPDGIWTEIEPTQCCPNCGAKMDEGADE